MSFPRTCGAPNVEVKILISLRALLLKLSVEIVIGLMLCGIHKMDRSTVDQIDRRSVCEKFILTRCIPCYILAGLYMLLAPTNLISYPALILLAVLKCIQGTDTFEDASSLKITGDEFIFFLAAAKTSLDMCFTIFCLFLLS